MWSGIWMVIWGLVNGEVKWMNEERQWVPVLSVYLGCQTASGSQRRNALFPDFALLGVCSCAEKNPRGLLSSFENVTIVLSRNLKNTVGSNVQVLSEKGQTPAVLLSDLRRCCQCFDVYWIEQTAFFSFEVTQSRAGVQVWGEINQSQCWQMEIVDGGWTVVCQWREGFQTIMATQ